jgi:hypothetical protein
MTKYKYHTLCEAYPAYEPDVYARRRDYYQSHPELADLVEVLLADDDGEEKIADGRHHYRICNELGYPCKFRRFEGTREELADLVEFLNANRRHMTPSQLAASAVAVNQYRRGGDRRSEGFKVSRDTLKQAAEKKGISEETIKRANKVANKAPEVLPSVRDGKLDAKTAAKVADLPTPARKKVVESSDPKAEARKQLAKAKAKKSQHEEQSHDVSGSGSTENLREQVNTSEPQAAEEEPTPAKPTKIILPPAVDAWGIPIQEHAVEAFAAVPEFKRMLAMLRDARKVLTPLCDSPGGRLLLKRCQFEKTDSKAGGRWVLAELDNAIGVIEDSMPRHTDCPYHFNTYQKHGTEDIGRTCPICDNKRFAGDLRKRQIPPDLLAAMKDHYGVKEGD